MLSADFVTVDSEIAHRGQDEARKELQQDRDLRLEEMKAHKLTRDRLELALKEKVCIAPSIISKVLLSGYGGTCFVSRNPLRRSFKL